MAQQAGKLCPSCGRTTSPAAPACACGHQFAGFAAAQLPQSPPVIGPAQTAPPKAKIRRNLLIVVGVLSLYILIDLPNIIHNISYQAPVPMDVGRPVYPPHYQPATSQPEPSLPEPNPSLPKIDDCLGIEIQTFTAFGDQTAVLNLWVTNTTQWPIKGWQGRAWAKNSFGDIIFNKTFEQYEAIQPNQRVWVQKTFHLNQFVPSDVHFARTPDSEINATIYPVTVQFADGTVISE